MKKLTLSALSVAIIAASAATVQAGSFEDDSTLNIHLRNYFKQDSNKDGTAKVEKDTGWAQAVRADFSSGYFADLVGFDLSAHYALKVHEKLGNNKASDTGLFLTRTAGADGKQKGHSYGKAFGAVKLNLMDHGVAKYGRMVVDTPLLNDSDSRSLPSTTQALYADYSMFGATVYGVFAQKENSKTESGYDEFGTVNGKSPVKIIGGSYKADGFDVLAAFGKQKNVKHQSYAEGSYTYAFDKSLSVTAGAQYGNTELVGDEKDAAKNVVTAAGKKLDDTINWWGAKLAGSYENLNASISYVKVKQTEHDGASGLASASQAWSVRTSKTTVGNDSTGFTGYNAVQISDFNSSGQKSIMYKVGYDFNDMVEGLTAYALYVDGKVDEPTGIKDVDTNEYNVRVDYKVPALEGLKVTLRHAKYEEDTVGKANDEVKKDTRVIVTYNLAVF